MVRGVGENDEAPPSGKKRIGIRRLASEIGHHRDEYVPKHPENPFGVVIVEHGDGLTPPPMAMPDPIETAALKFDQRAREVVRRPGPTPTQSSIIGAIQAQVITQKLDDLKETITKELLEQLRKDRDLERQNVTSAMLRKEKWSALWRGLIWKIVAGAAVVFAALREYFSASKK